MNYPILKSTFLGIDFDNPFIIPSGIIPEIPGSLKAFESGAGGVVTKSVTILLREGNPMPRVIKYEAGVLNSVGLRNPGIKSAVKLLEVLLQKSRQPVIISIFASAVNDFKKLAESVNDLNFHLLELNLSCPNTTNELGDSMGMGIESTEKAVTIVRKVLNRKIKIITKLSPNVQNIGDIAKAAEAAGADAISAINTVGPGMVIDLKSRKPILGNKEGGVSGPGIRPVAVRCIYDIYKSVKIPIIGMGGIETGKDAVELMLAGATMVGVGSAIYRHGYQIIEKIKADFVAYLKSNKLKSSKSLIGGSHRV